MVVRRSEVWPRLGQARHGLDAIPGLSYLLSKEGGSMQDVSFGGGIPTDLVARFSEDRRAFEDAEDALKAAEEKYRATEEAMWEAMLASGVSSIRIDGLGTCTRTVKGPYTSLDDNDPNSAAKFEAWCRENGYYDEIFRFAPQMARVNSIVREIRKRGEPIPEGTKVLEHRRIQVLKRKDK